MRLSAAHVTNYRSVIDSTEFEVEPDKTIVVGAYQEAEKVWQAQHDARQYKLNAASVLITQLISNVWGDDNLQLRLVVDGQYLKVVVVDDLGVEVELDQRSEGFRWLVSFFVVFRAQAKDQLNNAILLLVLQPVVSR